MPIKPSKDCPKTSKILPKWKNLVKSGHTVLDLVRLCIKNSGLKKFSLHFYSSKKVGSKDPVYHANGMMLTKLSSIFCLFHSFVLDSISWPCNPLNSKQTATNVTLTHQNAILFELTFFRILYALPRLKALHSTHIQKR